MAACKAEMPRLLLNPCEEGDAFLVPGNDGRMFMTTAEAEVYKGLEPKVGNEVLKFKSRTFPMGNGRASFTLSNSPPGQLDYIGAWIYLTSDSNISQTGFQLEDGRGGKFEALIPASWQGWKWVEFNLQDPAAFKATEVKAGGNAQIGFPLRSIRFVWTADKSGPNEVGVDGLAAVAHAGFPGKPYVVQLSGPHDGEANDVFRGQVVVNNSSDKPVDIDIRYTIRTDALLYDQPPPDPVYGGNRAYGCKSWVEVEGKRIEDDSLTDGDTQSFFSTDDFSLGGGTEGFQYLDLGQERKISKIDFFSGDPRWLHKVDFAASATEGGAYLPVKGLQGVDLANQWGGPNPIAVPEPFSARYLRLRYHNDGRKLDCAGSKKGAVAFHTVGELAVYDGIESDELEKSKIGPLVEQKEFHVTAPPRGFALLPLLFNTPLKTGNYYVMAQIKGPAGLQFDNHNHFVRSAQELKIGPESRFGMNSAVPGYAPQLKRLGTSWVRFENMKWFYFNEVPGKYDFKRDYIPLDTCMGEYHDAGLSILPYIFMAPAWASSSPPGGRVPDYPPKDYDDYGKAIFETVARYGLTKHPDDELHTDDKKSGLGWITTYEIWNEANLNSPEWGAWIAPIEKYFDLFRVAALALKKADPHSLVSTSGISGFPLETIDKFRTYRYSDGKSPLDLADILNVHFYTRTQEPEWTTEDPTANRNGEHSDEVKTYEKELIALADWRDRFKPSMPIWLTETGHDVGGPLGRTERYQAAVIPRNLMLALANGVEKTFLYREVGSRPIMHEGSGVIREDSTLRPSYFALATLTRQLDGVTDLRTLRLRTTNPQVWMYYWKRPHDRMLAAWTPKGTQPLGFDLGRCHVTDAFGRESDAVVTKDFLLSIFPVYITQVTSTAPLEQFRAEAVAREDQRRKDWDFLVDRAHLYLYDFGSHQNDATRAFGIPRPVVPVEAGDLYTPKNGYGFLDVGGENERALVEPRNSLERGSVVFRGPSGFRFQVDPVPAIYDVEFKAAKPASGANLVIQGAKEGETTLSLDDTHTTKVRITAVSGQPLQFKVPANIKVQWLTLVEIPQS